MKKYLVWMPALLILFACKEKKTSLQDDDEVTVAEFIEFFPETSLPYEVADTSLTRKQTDSASITHKIFTRFVPDSLISKDFGKTIKPTFYAIGSVREKDAATYLIAKAIAGKKRAVYLVAFNRKEEFQALMPLLITGSNYTSAYGLLDKKFQITTYREKKSRGDINYKKNVYFFNPETATFTLIFTEPNEDIIRNVINPIDTLPAKGKYAGDYVLNKRNFVSVRDGKNASEIMVFVHFEKDRGECKGEIKGRARFISPAVARYYDGSNPCTIEFSFTSNRVRMKETGGCGAYRDITCFFEGSYPKKK